MLSEVGEASRNRVAEGKQILEHSLRCIAETAGSLDPGEPATLTQLRSALRDVIAGGSDESPDLIGLLRQIADGVGAVEDGAVGDPASTCMALHAALQVAAENCGSTASGQAQEHLSGARRKLSGHLGAALAGPSNAASGDAEAPALALGTDADPELLVEFVAESLEHLQASEATLLALEDQPDDSEAIHRVLRAFHTIKGSSGFLELDLTRKIAHLAENILIRARAGEIRICGTYADLLLESCDTLRVMVERVGRLKPGESAPCPGNVLALLSKLESAEQTEPIVARSDPVPSREGHEPSPPANAEPSRTPNLDSTIRVNTGRLDNLVNMVGELVIAHSMIAEDSVVAEDSTRPLAKTVSRTGKITRELQDLTMALRMVPLTSTFEKMRRVARDLARRSGKSIRLTTSGQETEIDRKMVEALSDPLVHMMRNAIDHGIEPAEERRRLGKDEVGTVWLTACQSAGCVVIEIRDDGRGLDREKILAKAVAQGLIEAGSQPGAEQLFALIFHPGFSTAAQVTDVSGRGVGMDVVRRGIESLRGSIKLSSEPGAGTTFSMRFPLTLALADTLLLAVGRERYLLPTVSIQHSFHPAPDSLATVGDRGELVMFRGSPIPIVRLHRLFSVSAAVTQPAEGILIVVEAHGQRFALLADELVSDQQVVIRSLGGLIGRVPGVSAGAILGDGHVSLILDPAGIFALAQTAPPPEPGCIACESGAPESGAHACPMG